MQDLPIIPLREAPAYAEAAAHWFHEKWNIPEAAYQESIAACLEGKAAVLQWYLVLDGAEIVAGLGVIENDFHLRPDLTPNVCAVYVEEPYRCRGIAGRMLRFVCDDFAARGVHTLYLVTEHDSFYERYGWEFLCMMREQDSPHLTRMYRHLQKKEDSQ